MTSDLRAAFEKACAKWPTVTFDFEAFERFVLPLASTSALVLEDLALVDAVCRKAPGSHLVFEALVRSQARAALRRHEPSQIDEVIQLLLEKLLVGLPPRLTTYSGRGQLAAWLRASAVREALNLTRGIKATDGEAVLAQVEFLQTPVDLQVLQASHANEFKAAFRAALDSLSEQQRELLRLHVIENVSLSEISRRWSVHRVTLARWLELARHHLALSTREQLNNTLKLSVEEFESLVGFLHQQVDVSLTGLKQR